MAILNNNPLIGASGQSKGYRIERSLRFNSADSAYLNRTPGSTGNLKTWTWSSWLKRSALATSTYYEIFTSSDSGATTIFFYNNIFSFQITNSSGTVIGIADSVAVFRDVSAWYHIVAVLDTTQATGSDRIKLYVNGVQQTLTFTTTPSQNSEGRINSSSYPHYVGGRSAYPFSGYLAEINFIDGSALTPSSFGETDADTGVWKPKAYSGSYGTNGFYLKFADNSGTTSTTLGKDSSGNSNNWTPNNFSVTAGAGNDSLVDSPTQYGTDTGAGGEVRGNYCTFNPLAKGSTVTIANGNLDVANTTAGGAGKILGTIGVTSGKWYAEATMSGGGGMPGIAEVTASLSGYPGAESNSWGYNSGGDKYNGGSNAAYGATFTTNDVIGIALDMDNGSVTFYKNNVSQGVAYNTGISGKTITFAGRGDTSTTESWNFGQRPFAYTAPSGFKALCTTNLPTPTIGATATTRADDYFNTVLYTGNGSTQTVSGVGFQPDLVWNKQRSSSVGSNWLNDAVRGAGNSLSSNRTDAEQAFSAYFTAFNSDGFALAGGTDGFNANTSTYVAWNWKANGAGSSNTQGTITSTVSANTTAGFSIVTYVGTGTAGTIGHGLGATPSMIIVKRRSSGTAQSWQVFHSGISGMKDGYIYLNLTNAFTSGYSAIWNGTNPTSTVFSVGNDNDTNANGGLGYVAYCFAPVAGYSAFGSYTGNGSTDGPFIYTNFRPKYVLIRPSSAVDSWQVEDAARSPFNTVNDQLFPNTSDAEQVDSATRNTDFLSNGFKLRGTNGGVNGNGTTYIYAAFAEFPFKYTLAR